VEVDVEDEVDVGDGAAVGIDVVGVVRAMTELSRRRPSSTGRCVVDWPGGVVTVSRTTPESEPSPFRASAV